MESLSARVLGRIDHPGAGGRASSCPREAQSASLQPPFPARGSHTRLHFRVSPPGRGARARGVAAHAVAESQGHPPPHPPPGEAEAHEVGGGGSVREGRRRAGRVTVAPPDPVTSRRARREPRATLVLGEADSALAGGFWRSCPLSPRA